MTITLPRLFSGSATEPQRRLSLSVIALLLVSFVVATPVAGISLVQIPGFTPAYSSLLVVADLLTAALLLLQVRASGSVSISVLGAGYLLTGCLVVAQMLNFPGVFGPLGLMGGGAPAASWLGVFWHGLFPLFVTAYFIVAKLVPDRPGAEVRYARSIALLPWSVFAVAALLIDLALHSESLLPNALSWTDYSRFVTSGVGPLLFVMNLLAMVTFVRRNNRANMIEMWLGVAVLASLLDTSLSLIAQGRFSFGWYLARIDGVLASSAVLVALAYEYGRLQRVERNVREQAAIQERETERLRFLSAAGRILGEFLELESMIACLARHTTKLLCDRCVVAVCERGADRCALGVADFDADVERDREATLRRCSPAEAFAQLEATRAIETDAVQVWEDPSGDHHMVAPIELKGEIVGVIACARASRREAFSSAEAALAEELAARTAAAIVNAGCYQRERHLADALQRAMLPAVLPQLAGVVFDALHVPAGTDADIGGDWYDAFELPGGRVVFSIGDVAGRGLPAAIVMGKVRQAVRAFALTDADPRAIVANLDRMQRLDGALLVSAIVGVVDPSARLLTYVNAGHPGPILAEGDELELLELPRTLPLGLIDGETLNARTIALRPGQVLVFYTDGLIEMRKDIEAGEARLCEVVRNVVSSTSLHPSAAIGAAMFDTAPGDDVAILTIGVPLSPRTTLDVQLPATADSARSLRRAVRRVAREAGIGPERLFALEVAVGEAVANVMEHAYGASTGNIRLRAFGTSTEVSVEIIDFGRWRAPRSEGRGHGLNLIKQLCPSAEIVSDGRSTRVRLLEPIPA
jgi:anti-sigma regulatory factor (Ser/Thr protein kinase)